MNLWLFTIALAPALMLIWWLLSRGNWQGRNPLFIIWLVLGGALSALLALSLNNLVEQETLFWDGANNLWHYSIFWGLCVGLNEEFSKWLVLILLFNPRHTRPLPHAIMAAVAVATSFAVVENIFYLERFGTPVLLLRSVLTIPAHALFSIPLGIGISFSSNTKNGWAKYLFMLSGLLIAIIAHGGYDLMLTIQGLNLKRFAYLYLSLLALMLYLFLRPYLRSTRTSP